MVRYRVLYISPREVYLDHMTILFLTFEITAILMSMCNILQSITSNLLKLGWNFFSFFFMFYIMTVILTGVK